MNEQEYFELDDKEFDFYLMLKKEMKIFILRYCFHEFDKIEQGGSYLDGGEYLYASSKSGQDLYIHFDPDRVFHYALWRENKKDYWHLLKWHYAKSIEFDHLDIIEAKYNKWIKKEFEREFEISYEDPYRF